MRQKEKILEQFYEFPEKKFTIRELEKKTKIPRATVHRILNKLKEENLVTSNNKSNETLIYKIKKINYFVEKIVKSGLIEELIEKQNPSCIILFGSIRKGESVNKSDIDIFIETFEEKKIDIKKYEKILKHKIEIFNETSIKKLPENLKYNIINGIKLYGTIDLK